MHFSIILSATSVLASTVSANPQVGALVKNLLHAPAPLTTAVLPTIKMTLATWGFGGDHDEATKMVEDLWTGILAMALRLGNRARNLASKDGNRGSNGGNNFDSRFGFPDVPYHSIIGSAIKSRGSPPNFPAATASVFREILLTSNILLDFCLTLAKALVCSVAVLS